MKKIFSKFVVAMMVLSMFISGAFTTIISFANEGDTFNVVNFKLSKDGGVIANYNKEEKSIIITGKGKIEVDLMQNLKTEKLGINDVAGWGSMDASKLVSLDIQSKDVQLPDNCENLFYNFSGEIKINSQINTSNIVNMNGMFWGSTANPDVSYWDVSKVKSFHNMFAGDDEATPDVSRWNVSNAIDFSGMFTNGANFTPDVSKWNVSMGENFSSMFQGALSNPEVSNWNMENAEDLSYMFKGAKKANPNVSRWNVSNVSNFKQMFSKASSANPDVSKWNTSSAKDMSYMFMGATTANPDVSHWNVSEVVDFTSMFSFADLANPNVRNWDIRNAIKLTAMFYGTKKADPDVSHWNTKSVQDMSYMFNSSISANPDVSNWDTSNVANFQGMFAMSKAVDVDVSKWNVSKVTVSKYMADMFRDSQIKKLDFSKWKINPSVDTSAIIIGMSNLEELKTGEFMLTLCKDSNEINRMLPKNVEYNGFVGDYDIIQIKRNSKHLISTHKQNEKFVINEGIDKNYYIIKPHKTVKVTFHTNCNDKIDAQEFNANMDSLLKEPNQITNKGMKLTGWYIDREFKNKFDFSMPITKDYDLYAKWEKDAKKVTNKGNQVDETYHKNDKNYLGNKHLKSNIKKNTYKLTKTGDYNEILIYVFMMILTAITFIIVVKIRDKNI